MSCSTGFQAGLIKTFCFFFVSFSFFFSFLVFLHYYYAANTILMKQKEPPWSVLDVLQGMHLPLSRCQEHAVPSG